LNRRAGYFLITLAIVILDQLSKRWAMLDLRGNSDIVIIPGLLNLSYTTNAGIAFGMLGDSGLMVKWMLMVISIAAAVFVAAYALRTPLTSRLLLVSLALLLAGILGNLIDRMLLGYVIDFIDIHYESYHWPTFNLADMAISIGAILLAIDLLRAHQTQSAAERPVNVDENF